MSLFVFDTDVLTHLERGDENVIANVRIRSPRELSTTVITVEQKLSGWYSVLRKARKVEQIVHAYNSLAEAVILLRPLHILTMTMPAYDRFLQLQSLKLGVGKADLKIAAIVLENRGVLVTKNLRDFARVPGLNTVDWTRVEPSLSEN